MSLQLFSRRHVEKVVRSGHALRGFTYVGRRGRYVHKCLLLLLIMYRKLVFCLFLIEINYSESRRRVYRRKYEYTGEVSRRASHKENNHRKTEISVCAVQNREIIGITEVILDLTTYMSSLRCLHDCEIYTLNLKPFR